LHERNNAELLEKELAKQQLPRTALLKIDRRALRALAR
jgi:acyl-coenzyme A synthetase/AMP-(fatty) acid ligase